ncbi:MAG: carbohydrate ABC transporter permease [Anaerocolumna sp.]
MSKDNTASVERKKVNNARKKNLVAYSFILPNFIGFVCLTLIPIAFSFVLSVCEWDAGNTSTVTFVGFNNFKKMISDSTFLISIKNTVYYSLGVVPCTLLLSLLLAMLMNCHLKGRTFFRSVIFFPYVASLVAVASKFGLTNSHLGLILMHTFTAFGVFLIRQFYMGIPNDLLEAARIDGLSEYGIWAKIMIPLSKPAIATLCITSFVNEWNDFMGPLIYLSDDRLKTLQLGLRLFIGQFSADYQLIMAASIISLFPVFIMFISVQKYFVEGVATTGMKG